METFFVFLFFMVGVKSDFGCHSNNTYSIAISTQNECTVCNDNTDTEFSKICLPEVSKMSDKVFSKFCGVELGTSCPTSKFLCPYIHILKSRTYFKTSTNTYFSICFPPTFEF